MYDKIKQALLDRGYSDWLAGMTAEKIDDCGAEVIKEVLDGIFEEAT
jgi:hypothetical protein